MPRMNGSVSLSVDTEHDSRPARPTLSAAGQVDRLCDEFEASWRRAIERNEVRPEVSEFLGRVADDEQADLFRELLEIELDLRCAQGESVSAEEYHRRFPDFVYAVDPVYARAVRSRRLGDYQLFEELGRGGMGVVYRARHVLLDQTVALKLPIERHLDDPHIVARFRREMRSIGQLRHPNIVQAYNAGAADGVHFLVMEFVDGGTINRLVSQCGGLSVGAACDVVRQAALGLEHARVRGVVHRDVKPGNLMLDSSGTVKLLDFGLARLAVGQTTSKQPAERLTNAWVTMGTADYMAPEQWERPSEVDSRADIYGLGCTLFYMLAGHAPYANSTHGSLREKLLAHLHAPIPSLAEHVPALPKDLDKILRQMMAKNADARFDTPGEAAEAIGPFAEPRELERLVPSVNESDSQAITPLDADVHSADVETTGEPLKDSQRYTRTRPKPKLNRLCSTCCWKSPARISTTSNSRIP